MSIRMYRCDRDDCKHYVRDHNSIPAGWIKVNDGAERYFYCSWNCLMLDAATVPAPTEV